MTHSTQSLIPTSPETYRIQVEACLRDAESKFIRLCSSESGDSDTLEAYDELMRQIEQVSAPASLFSNVHPDEAIRTIAESAEQQSQALATRISLSRELFDRISSCSIDSSDEMRVRLHTKIIQDFKRSGIALDKQTQEKISVIRNELTRISQEFEKNIREDVRSIRVHPSALEGLPDDFRSSHTPDETGLVTITTDYPDYRPFMTYAHDSALRKELYLLFNNRGYPKNEPILRDLLVKRFELARLLGYATWADYVAEDKMIQSESAIQSFIDSVHASVIGASEREYETLLKRKQQAFPDAVAVEEWEKAYWEERVKQESYAFNSQEIRPYFEYARVKDGLLSLSSELFGITFTRITTETWHPSVEVYDVFEESTLRGRIYLDMHPRDNKYKHAAQFTLQSGKRDVQIPHGVLVCNFTDPSVQTPALMDHDQVTTFFHEFGHLLHHILGGNQKFIYFSGVATEWDFVEAPSQLFEEWAWDASVLQRFAKHIETNAPIPAELVTRMHDAYEFGKALATRRQLTFAATSVGLYAKNPLTFDVHERVVALHTTYSIFEHMPEVHHEYSFGHLDGYSAIYYTYMWSLVIAKDLLSRFTAEGMCNTETARAYRTEILEAGGSRDARELIVRFLGRPYTVDAFNTWLNQ